MQLNPDIEITPEMEAMLEAEGAARAAVAYRFKRENHFNQFLFISDQLDNLYHDIENGTLDTTGEFFTAIKAVKDKFPKPE
jgi:hypothetical protein